MKAIRLHQTGGPEVLRLEDVPIPSPGPGEVLIKVAVAGVNYADLGVRAGMFHPGGHGAPRLPLTPGFEVAGTVAALGPGVTGPPEGARVGAVLEDGGYAEWAVAPLAKVMAIPDGIDFAAATALLIQGPTAYGVLHDAGRLQPGEAVLVQAAAGGVGSLAVQLAKLAGAGTVVGTAGSAEKLALARDLGADAVVGYEEGAWVDRVREATGGRGVDLVLESVGGAIGAGAWDCLAPLGRYVPFGGASGQPGPPPDLMRLNVLGQSLVGFGGPWLRPGRAVGAREAMAALIRDGRLRIVVGPSFPLAEAAAAHRAVAERATTGKVVLTL